MEDFTGGVDEDVDDDHAVGGWSPPEAIPVAFPLPISGGGSGRGSPSNLRWF